ncbi:MAG: hypothetical protein GXP31_01785 [Kiritimatiellaeota bacterium]|nr:hypothetical protein [Kiritimatiellota bacterium]
MFRSATVLTCAVAALSFSTVLRSAPDDPSMRRALLFKVAKHGDVGRIAFLAKGLDDSNMIVRRTAVRLLAEQGPPARAALEEATGNTDALVRRTAFLALWDLSPDRAVKWFDAALRDVDPAIRLTAVGRLAALRPGNPEVRELLARAEKTGDDRVRAVAVRALWPFHREDRSIRRRADWDHTITVVKTIPLPRDEWRFRLDPKREGHLEKWFAPAFDDSDWDRIAIEQAWQKAGYDYTGVAWYRRRIELPEKPAGMNAAEICLDGVDESAWIWINGRYVGEHDVGPTGWNKPFTLDITQEVLWGKPNLVVVRAMNTAHNGGVWRPIRIEILK